MASGNDLDVTINIAYKDAFVVNSVEKAIEQTKPDPKPYIVGGGEIYELFMKYSSCIELTRIHHKFKSDTFFPKINLNKWEVVKRQDVKNNFASSIMSKN